MVESALAIEIGGILLGWQIRDPAVVPIIEPALDGFEFEGDASLCQAAIRDILDEGADPKPVMVAVDEHLTAAPMSGEAGQRNRVAGFSSNGGVR